MLEIITALLGGSSAGYLRESIRGLSSDDRQDLCRTLRHMRDEVAANCRERADEIDRVLASNGASPSNHKIYDAQLRPVPTKSPALLKVSCHAAGVGLI